MPPASSPAIALVPPPIRVFVVEDQPAIRQALTWLLEGTDGFVCAGTAGSAEEALDAAPQPQPDVVLLDIGLPGRSGIEAVGPIRERWPRADVVMLTVLDDEGHVFDALCAGATGYLLKATPPAELLDAVREVHAGGAPMSASVARRVVGRLHRPAPKPAEEALSEREREVLDRLVEGKTYGQIAEELFVSRNTVAFHVKRIYAKLHAASRAELIARALGR